MTLLFADGFEDGMGDWAVNGSLSTPAGRNGLCAAIGGNGSTISKTFTPSVTVVVGFAHKVNNYDNGELDIIQLCGDSGATQHTTLRASNVGTGLYVYKGGSKFNVLGTANNVTVMNQWAYIEVRFTLHDSTGIVIVKVNGTTVINSTNVDTRESGTVAAYDCIKLTNYFNTASVDDLYICDTTGSYNNDFLGDLVVEHIRPTGDDTVAWTKSTGATNYGCVDEAGAADTADYVSSSTVGQRDLYSTAAAARAAGTVQGVYVAATAQKSDAGTRSVGLCVKEPAGYGANQSAFTSQTPNGSSVNAGEWGNKITCNVAGRITAIRFYKTGSMNSSSPFRIWDVTGQTVLGSVTIDASGLANNAWHLATLGTPVTVTAGQQIVSAVSSTAGGGWTIPYHTSLTTFTNGDLTVVAGVKTVTVGSYPSGTEPYFNFFDVVFQASSSGLRTGAGQALTTGWVSYGQGFDRKADNSAFSIADLNALRVGAEVTA